VPNKAHNHRILVLGGTTHDNLGDLAMQAGIVDWIHSNLPGLAVDFLSSNPDKSSLHINAERHLQSPDQLLATTWTRETPVSTAQRRSAIKLGYRFTRNKNWPEETRQRVNEFFAALDAASAVMIPGSGSMNSLWWHDWLYPKAFTVLAACRSGKPTFMSSQGIGPPFTNRLDERVAGRMFGACSLIGVRDGNASAEILHSLGIDRDQIVTTGDDALLFKSPDPLAAVTAELPSIPPGRKVVGINLRESSTYGAKYPKLDLQYMAAFLDDIGTRHDLHFLFIPISRDAQDSDHKTAEAIIEKMNGKHRARLITEKWDAEQTRHLVGSTDFALGISYHFLLFALSSSTPTLGVYQNPYYRQKLSGLFNLYGCPAHAIELNPEDPSLMPQSFDRLISRKDNMVQLLEEENNRLNAIFTCSRKQLVEALMKTIEED
jgi:polysaccharide pyruvyl transferase WcaK-like protein